MSKGKADPQGEVRRLPLQRVLRCGCEEEATLQTEEGEVVLLALNQS
jgi:hypothetical protein